MSYLWLIRNIIEHSCSRHFYFYYGYYVRGDRFLRVPENTHAHHCLRLQDDDVRAKRYEEEERIKDTLI